MNNLTTRLQIGTIAMLALTAGALTMNTCAMDRLEKQVIANRLAVEKLENSGLGGGVVSVAPSQTSAGVPGTGTGMTASGWGGSCRKERSHSNTARVRVKTATMIYSAILPCS